MFHLKKCLMRSEAVNRTWIVKRANMLDYMHRTLLQKPTMRPANNYLGTGTLMPHGPFYRCHAFPIFHWNKNKPNCSIYHAKMVISYRKFHKKPTVNSWKYGSPQLSSCIHFFVKNDKCGVPYCHEFAVGFLWIFVDFEITNLAW